MGRRWYLNVKRWLTVAIWSQIAYLTLAFGRSRAPSVAPDTSIVEVRDRGSDLTIVSFAGLAALHGGMVNFEFTNLLQKRGINANLVFVRDPRCACYHLAPDGSSGGVAYYENRLREVLKQLGSRHHVAIGTSIGGMAAVLFGHRLQMDQIIAFSPSWPPQRYMIRGGLRAHLRILRSLVLKPVAYIERLVLAQMAGFVDRLLRSAVGDGIVDLEKELQNAEKRPQMAIYYAAGCEPDVETVRSFTRFPGVESVALPTAMHNTIAFLRSHGDLVSLIHERVDAAMSSRGVVRKSTIPPPADEVSVLVAGAAS